MLTRAHFLVHAQNHGEIKGWRIKLWRISYQPLNPPKFSPANVLCYSCAPKNTRSVNAFQCQTAKSG